MTEYVNVVDELRLEKETRLMAKEDFSARKRKWSERKTSERFSDYHR